MTAQHNSNNGMWVYKFDKNNIAKKQTMVMNNVYGITKMKELVTFMHAAAGYPVVDTWTKAIRNNQFATWSGLTSALVYKNLPKSDETVKGHLKQQRQHVQPMQIQHDPEPNPIQSGEQTNNVFAAIVYYHTTKYLQTPQVPFQSLRAAATNMFLSYMTMITTTS